MCLNLNQSQESNKAWYVQPQLVFFSWLTLLYLHPLGKQLILFWFKPSPFCQTTTG